MILGDTLDKAKKLLLEERYKEYGSVVYSFNRIQDIACILTGKRYKRSELALILLSVKLAREQYKHKTDNVVDAMAYLEIYNFLTELESLEKTATEVTEAEIEGVIK